MYPAEKYLRSSTLAVFLLAGAGWLPEDYRWLDEWRA